MHRRALQFVVDAGILALAFFLAYMLRYDGLPPSNRRFAALMQLPYAVLIELLLLTVIGLHKTSWRYVSLSDVPRIGLGLLSAAAVLLAFRLGLPQRWHIGRIPIGIIAANVVLAGVGLLAARILRRLESEWRERKRLTGGTVKRGNAKRMLLIGAGRAGAMAAREINSRPDLRIEAIGFVDDDPRKLGTYIHGLRVLGDTESIQDVVEEHKIDVAIISIANANGQSIRRLHRICEAVPIPVKIIPGMYEIIGGRVNISRLRDVNIEDLLGREQVELDADAVAGFIQDKRVLVTGAGGSIGSELCRQIALFEPAEIVMLEQAENALFEIDREMRQRFNELRLVPVIADICDEVRLRDVFKRCDPQVVFHAAAHKHVPMMELNPWEAVKNNSLGTKKVTDVAADSGCEVMVMISTDKAVNPTSIMGASKRFAELYVQGKARLPDVKTKYVAVRFGNVLGSAGSVIPIFRKQIADGGPVTVTHPDMQRFFMTIPEACQLVMQAATMSKGGEIFVLDMGKPVKIVDLARDMIRLSGFREPGDIQIEFSGVRPGEKLYEEISLGGEDMDKTKHPKIYIGRLETYSPEQVKELYDRLSAAAEIEQVVDARKIFGELLPEFQADATESKKLREEILNRTPPLGSDAQQIH